MLLLLLTVLIPCNSFLTTAARADEPSTGPTSASEPAILWKDGQAAFQSGHYQDAINALSRLTTRYASVPGFTEAHLLIGKSELALHDAEAAIPPLKYYIQAMGNRSEALNGKLQLAQAYLDLGRNQEAYQTSLEILRPGPKRLPKQLDDEVRLRGLLIKSHSLLAQNKDTRAAEALASVKKDLRTHRELPGDVKAETLATDLELHDRSCHGLAARGTKSVALDEAHARAEFALQSDCLLESCLIFKDVLRAGDAHWAELATQDLLGAFQGFHKAAANPPTPPGKRTALELSRYKTELKEIMQRDEKTKISESLKVLDFQKEPLPTGMGSQLQKVTSSLTQLKGQ